MKYFLLLLLLPTFVFAQATEDNSLRITTSPLPVNLITEPGHQISTDLKVRNDGNKEEQLKLTILKFKAYTENGDPEILTPEPEDDFINWVTFSEKNFTLAPKEWKTITATFNVPETASFGYYYAFVFSRDQDPTAKNQETAIVGGTATLVLLEARVPNAIRQVEVAEFKTDKPWYEFLPVNFSVRLKNSGNVHVSPRGNIFLINRKKEVDRIILNQEKRNILPDSYRIFEEDWANGFPVYQKKIENGEEVIDQDGKPIQTLAWDFNNVTKLRFGKYTARMLLVYDDGQRDIPIEAETSFWVVPWRLIGGMAVVLIFALLGLKSTIQNIIRSIINRFRKNEEENVQPHE